LNSAVVRNVRDELKGNADEATRISALRFFKEEVRMYGIKSAVVRKIAKRYYKEIKKADKAEIFRLCEELWRSGYMEESFIACEWSYSHPQGLRRWKISRYSSDGHHVRHELGLL